MAVVIFSNVKVIIMLYNKKDATVKIEQRRKLSSVYVYYDFKRLCFLDASLQPEWTAALPVRLSSRMAFLTSSHLKPLSEEARMILLLRMLELRGANDNARTRS